MGFLSPTDFRWILPSETDANSPLSEELMSQLRENTEANTMNRIYSGYRAQIVTRDSDTQLTMAKISDDDQDWATNIAVGLILVFRTGAALSESFTITANTQLLDSPDTATITTSGTFPTGLLAGDEFVMMYVQTGRAHTHDGVDSAPIGSDINIGSAGTAPTIYGGYSEGVDHRVLAANSFGTFFDISTTINTELIKAVYVTGQMDLSSSSTDRGAAYYRNISGLTSLELWLAVPAQTHTVATPNGDVVTYTISAYNEDGSQNKFTMDSTQLSNWPTTPDAVRKRLIYTTSKLDISQLTITPSIPVTGSYNGTISFSYYINYTDSYGTPSYFYFLLGLIGSASVV